MLGVVRHGDGKFAGQLTFIEPASDVLANAPGLASAAALQLQLAAIERRLDEIHVDVGYLVESGHIEIEAELTAALDTLHLVFDEVMAAGDLSDTQWDRVANVEQTVRSLHHQTSAHLRSLGTVLEGDEASLRERVTKLNEAVRTNHTDLWLDYHLLAEKALTRWETLYLLRRIDEHPERADELGDQLRDAVVERHQGLVGLAEGIAGYLDRGGQLNSWLDRLRLISRQRLYDLLAELDDILASYSGSIEALGLDPHQPAAVAASDALASAGRWEELKGVLLDSRPAALSAKAVGAVGRVPAALSERVAARRGDPGQTTGLGD